MKKCFLLMLVIAVFTITAQAKLSFLKKADTKDNIQKEVKSKKSSKTTEKIYTKDIIKDKEYAQIKTEFFNAEGYGELYNCPVATQRFCRVKNYDTGIYVMCDRDTTRTQMESAKVFYKLGKCVKLN